MQDYTQDGDIIRGSRWPAADEVLTIQLTKASGWPADADEWTWELCLSRTLRGGAPDLVLEASNVFVSDEILQCTFYATPAQTAALPGTGRTQFYVDLRSTETPGTTTTPAPGASVDIVSYYDCVHGVAWVRNPAGEA